MKINNIRCVNSTILFTPEAITHYYYAYGKCYSIAIEMASTEKRLKSFKRLLSYPSACEGYESRYYSHIKIT